MQAGELLVVEQRDPALRPLADHHRRVVTDVGREVGIQLVQVEQDERDAEVGHGPVPRSLAAERRVGDVAQAARLPVQVVPGEVAQLAAQAAVRAVDADEPGEGHASTLRPIDAARDSGACGVRERLLRERILGRAQLRAPGARHDREAELEVHEE